MAATAVVAETEVCDDAQHDCMQANSLLASKTTVSELNHANTPTVDLAGLADSSGAASTEQATKSSEMKAGSKEAAKAAVAALKKADTASRASDMHDRASATSRDASNLAAEASASRTQADEAKAKADFDKATLESLKEHEAGCEQAATTAEKEKRKAQVLAQTKHSAVEAQKAALANLQERLKQVTADKKKIDDDVIALSREAEGKKEKATEATTKEAEAKAKLDAADEKFQEAVATFDAASAEQTTTSVKLGQAQAVASEEEAKKNIAKDGRNLARNVYET